MASNLTEPLKYSVAVSSRSIEFVGYLVGGYTKNVHHKYSHFSSKIWGLRRSDQQWIDTSKRLKMLRKSFTVVNVHDNQLPNCRQKVLKNK